MSEAVREIPRYKCHKEVHALKIKLVAKHAHPDPGADDAAFEASPEFQGAHLMPEDEQYAPIPVTADWFRKHNPKAGGYYVVYEDGYTSYSPADAFEKGYTLMNPPEPVETKLYSGVRAAKQIDNSFTYHPPKGNQANRYNSLRTSARDLAELFAMYCPESRELSLAMTKLEEASMWANAAIARNE